MLFARSLVLTVAVLSGSFQASAQTPPKPGPDESAPAKAPAAETPPKSGPDDSDEGEAPAAGKAPGKGKRGACMDAAKAKRLRGLERLDSIQLCMAEARVDCVKEAIAKKMPASERKTFLKSCMTD